MGIKILWQWEQPGDASLTDSTHPGKALVWETMLKFVRKVARPDTKIEPGYVDYATHANWLLYPRTVGKVSMLNKVIQAERDGYDAVTTALCFGDFFLDECRQALRIPVLGGGESGMMVAQLVGKKFAIVTVYPRYIQPMEANIRLRGWEDRAIKYRPVRHFEPWYWDAMIAALHGKPDKLIADFEKVALECVRDGADTIICGCIPCGIALAMSGYREVRGTGVPVVPAAAAMVKLAEVMVDLKRSLGLTKTEAEVGPYRTTPPEIWSRIQQDFGFVRPLEVNKI